jgi:peptide-methionine (R)-S-oxide reductase
MKALILVALALAHPAAGPIDKLVKAAPNQKFAVVKSDAEWKKELPRATYLVLRKAGTERPYSGKFWDFHDKGVFVCAACGEPLFGSDAKFDSHTGWPSFFQEIRPGATLTRPDVSDGDERTEVICARCGGHLGHVFDDGPGPTGLRYCMNSPALKFIKAK